MPSLEQLIQSIDARIEQLHSEIASLQVARSALVSNGAAPTPRSPANAKSMPRRRRVKTRKPLTAAAVEQLLAASDDGLTTAAVAQRAGADRDQVLALMRGLEKARRVRRTGQRRSTRWHAITDEDRVRERAAELATRVRP